MGIISSALLAVHAWAVLLSFCKHCKIHNQQVYCFMCFVNFLAKKLDS